MKYKIGQRVKIRDFSAMANEFGVQENGNILVGNYYFTREMKVYCGEEYCITALYGDGYELDLQDGEEWYFNDGMLIDSEQEPIVASVEIKALKAEIQKLKNTIKFYENQNIEEVKPKRTYTRRK